MPKKHVFSILFAVLAFGGIIVLPASSYAEQKHSQLTEDNIRAFVEETSKMTSGADFELSKDEIVDYLEKHLHKKAHFKSTMTYDIPGFPSRTSSMSLDKEEFIENIENGAQSLSDYKNKVEVKSIRISRDKTKATIQTTGFETAVMPVPTGPDTTEPVPIEGQSTCLQILTLEEGGGVIQMFTANCTTVIHFAEDY